MDCIHFYWYMQISICSPKMFYNMNAMRGPDPTLSIFMTSIPMCKTLIWLAFSSHFLVGRFCLAQTHGDQVNLFEVYQSFSAVLETPVSEEPCSKRKSQKSPKKTVQKMDRALLQYPSIWSHTYTHARTHTHVCISHCLFFINCKWTSHFFVCYK